MTDELIYNNLLMQPLGEAQLDRLMAEGYRILGHSIIQHNKSRTFGVLCDTIPLRIRLKGFTLSKSQKRILRKNRDLTVKQRRFELTKEKVTLFEQHARRFKDNHAESTIDSFLTTESGFLPTEGKEFFVYDGKRLLASGICHLGEKGINSTYGMFDPNETHRSLGIFTMLLEIEWAIQQGKEYYYLGYTNSLPSQFDYKLNFKNLEKMSWNTFKWKPAARMRPVNWLEYWEGESIEEWNGINFAPK